MKKNNINNDIHCVFEGIGGNGNIYISGVKAATDQTILKNFNIKAVVSVTATIVMETKNDRKLVEIDYYMHIPVLDCQQFKISEYFQRTYDFIQQARKTTNVLVHCQAGISRSSTIVLAYLMKKYKYSCNQLLALLKRKRKQINPNKGFIKQLQQYEQKLRLQKKKEFKSVIATILRQSKQIKQKRSNSVPLSYKTRQKQENKEIQTKIQTLNKSKQQKQQEDHFQKNNQIRQIKSNKNYLSQKQKIKRQNQNKEKQQNTSTSYKGQQQHQKDKTNLRYQHENSSFIICKSMSIDFKHLNNNSSKNNVQFLLEKNKKNQQTKIKNILPKIQLPQSQQISQSLLYLKQQHSSFNSPSHQLQKKTKELNSFQILKKLKKQISPNKGQDVKNITQNYSQINLSPKNQIKFNHSPSSQQLDSQSVFNRINLSTTSHANSKFFQNTNDLQLKINRIKDKLARQYQKSKRQANLNNKSNSKKCQPNSKSINKWKYLRMSSSPNRDSITNIKNQNQIPRQMSKNITFQIKPTSIQKFRQSSDFINKS